MSNKLTTIIQEQGVSHSETEKLIQVFGGPFEEAGEILATYQNIVVSSESDTEAMAQAREKRIILKKARTTVENARKELKADILKQGRAIDSIARFVKEEIQPAEEYLRLQEDYLKIKRENERQALLAERTERLAEYTDDTSVYSLDSLSPEQFDSLLARLKTTKEAELAEERRLAEEEKARLRAEAEEKERIRQENERIYQENARLRAEAEELAKKEQARIEAELRAKIEAEELAKKEQSAPDKDKLTRFVKGLELVVESKLPLVESDRAKDIAKAMGSGLEELIAKAKSEISQL